MIPVEQRARFDCMRACLASIFECPYEDAPELGDPDTGDPVDQWMRVMTGWLRDRGFWPQNFGLTTHLTEIYGERPERSPWHWPTVWMGSVLSPRHTDPDGTPSGHAVVCRGSDIVWDPHPQREMGHLGFMGAEVFLPIEPAALVHRPLLVPADEAASVAHDYIWGLNDVTREQADAAIWKIHRALRPGDTPA